jgi:hypothetical protein
VRGRREGEWGREGERRREIEEGGRRAAVSK